MIFIFHLSVFLSFSFELPCFWTFLCCSRIKRFSLLLFSKIKSFFIPCIIMWWENWNNLGQKRCDNVTLISLTHLKKGFEQNCPLNKDDEARICDEVGPTAQLCSKPTSKRWKLGRMCWPGQDAWWGCPETGLFTLAGTLTQSEAMLGRSSHAITRGNSHHTPDVFCYGQLLPSNGY